MFYPEFIGTGIIWSSNRILSEEIVITVPIEDIEIVLSDQQIKIKGQLKHSFDANHGFL